MSFIVYTKNKNGSIYAYEVTSFRDPVSKGTRQKRVYLGKYDEETQSIIPKQERKSRTPQPQETPDKAAPSVAKDTDVGNQEENAKQRYTQVLATLQRETQILSRAFSELSRITGEISAELSELDIE